MSVIKAGKMRFIAYALLSSFVVSFPWPRGMANAANAGGDAVGYAPYLRDRGSCAVDTAFFPDTHSTCYRSWTSYVLYDRYAWLMYFSHGLVENHNTPVGCQARCVRSEWSV
jgi:hypothetical protein